MPTEIKLTIIQNNMTKAEIVSNISNKLGIDKSDVQITIEKFMGEIKDSLESGNNVYLRGFGSFIIKKRAKKTGRNISKNTAVSAVSPEPAQAALAFLFCSSIST